MEEKERKGRKMMVKGKKEFDGREGKEGRKEERKEGGKKEDEEKGRKEGRKEGRKMKIEGRSFVGEKEGRTIIRI
ncbi:Cyclic nucleotide-gated cation channel beta-1, partial [Ophiophagus hannah]